MATLSRDTVGDCMKLLIFVILAATAGMFTSSRFTGMVRRACV
uniref:Uncharacterized protein n=1 Tax=Anguilla anguilla TaxID=7936 RepID=A0A0E9Y2G2_ANGAN